MATATLTTPPAATTLPVSSSSAEWPPPSSSSSSSNCSEHQTLTAAPAATTPLSAVTANAISDGGNGGGCHAAMTLAKSQPSPGGGQAQPAGCASKKTPNVPELKIEQNSPLSHGGVHCKGGGGQRTPLSSASLLPNGGFLETPTPKIPDLLRTPTALLTSPTNTAGSKCSQLVHIDELNTPLCLNSATPKSQHSQAFFGDHEPLLTGPRAGIPAASEKTRNYKGKT